MSTAIEGRVWHVQESLDPRAVALMCPWAGCGCLSPVDRQLMPELAGRALNCRFCGLPSIVPSTLGV